MKYLLVNLQKPIFYWLISVTILLVFCAGKSFSQTTQQTQISHQTSRSTPDEFKKHQKAGTAILLDVRGKSELRFGKIENTINIPLYILENNYQDLPKDKLIITFCNNGSRSFFAYEILVRNGFKKVKHLNIGVRFNIDGTYKVP
jgi:rhodanese-related sulfurtransferase